MSKIYGYCRISKKSQNIDRQIRNIKKEYPDAIIVDEAFTGRTTHRPKFEQLLRVVKPDDTIVFDSVSRMSRDSQEGVLTYFALFDTGVNLIFLKEHYIDTSVYAENIKDTAWATISSPANISSHAVYMSEGNNCLKSSKSPSGLGYVPSIGL